MGHDCNWKGSSRKAKHQDGELFCPQCLDLKPVVQQPKFKDLRLKFEADIRKWEEQTGCELAKAEEYFEWLNDKLIIEYKVSSCYQYRQWGPVPCPECNNLGEEKEPQRMASRDEEQCTTCQNVRFVDFLKKFKPRKRTRIRSR